MTKTTTAPALRWTLIVTLAVLAFFATYQFAVARTSVAPAAAAVAAAPTQPAPTPGAPTQDPAAPATSGGGCACGGSKAPAGATSKAAEVSGDVQKLTVDTSTGYYDPSAIELKAGVPAEITFTQSSGCLQEVESADLGFSEDLTGGPKTIKLGALAAGTYGFNCGMQMQFGTIVVK